MGDTPSAPTRAQAIEFTRMALAEAGHTNVNPTELQVNGAWICRFYGSRPGDRSACWRAFKLVQLRLLGPDHGGICLSCHLVQNHKCPRHPVGWMLATGGGCR